MHIEQQPINHQDQEYIQQETSASVSFVFPEQRLLEVLEVTGGSPLLETIIEARRWAIENGTIPVQLEQLPNGETVERIEPRAMVLRGENETNREIQYLGVILGNPVEDESLKTEIVRLRNEVIQRQRVVNEPNRKGHNKTSAERQLQETQRKLWEKIAKRMGIQAIIPLIPVRLPIPQEQPSSSDSSGERDQIKDNSNLNDNASDRERSKKKYPAWVMGLLAISLIGSLACGSTTPGEVTPASAAISAPAGADCQELLQNGEHTDEFCTRLCAACQSSAWGRLNDPDHSDTEVICDCSRAKTSTATWQMGKMPIGQPSLEIQEANDGLGQRIADTVLQHVGECGDGAPGRGDQEINWCTDFVSAVLLEAGTPFTGGEEGGWLLTDHRWMQKWFEAQGLWSEDITLVQIGDCLKWDWGHSGFVVGVANGILTTVEGSVDDCVVKREWSITDESIVGFGRPTQSPIVQAVPKPEYSIQVGENTTIPKEIAPGVYQFEVVITEPGQVPAIPQVAQPPPQGEAQPTATPVKEEEQLPSLEVCPSQCVPQYDLIWQITSKKDENGMSYMIFAFYGKDHGGNWCPQPGEPIDGTIEGSGPARFCKVTKEINGATYVYYTKLAP